jgi:hypothetical protein
VVQHLLFKMILIFLMGLGLNHGFELAKQALYHLSHISSPLCCSYFGDGGGLKNYLPKLASNHDPPNLSLPSS